MQGRYVALLLEVQADGYVQHLLKPVCEFFHRLLSCGFGS